MIEHQDEEFYWIRLISLEIHVTPFPRGFLSRHARRTRQAKKGQLVVYIGRVQSYQSVNQSINLSINQSAYQSINQSLNLSVHQSIYHSINQSINQQV